MLGPRATASSPMIALHNQTQRLNITAGDSRISLEASTRFQKVGVGVAGTFNFDEDHHLLQALCLSAYPHLRPGPQPAGLHLQNTKRRGRAQNRIRGAAPPAMTAGDQPGLNQAQRLPPRFRRPSAHRFIPRRFPVCAPARRSGADCQNSASGLLRAAFVDQRFLRYVSVS